MRLVDKELYYNLFKGKIKVGEQIVNFKMRNETTIFLDSSLNISDNTTISHIEMINDSFLPKKIEFKSRSTVFNREVKLSCENSKICLNDGEKEVWFKGNIYDNIQALFMAPFLAKSSIPNSNGLLSINIILLDLSNVITVNGIDVSQSSKEIAYEILSPIKYYAEYSLSDSLLNYYYSAYEKVEIKRT